MDTDVDRGKRGGYQNKDKMILAQRGGDDDDNDNDEVDDAIRSDMSSGMETTSATNRGTDVVRH